MSTARMRSLGLNLAAIALLACIAPSSANADITYKPAERYYMPSASDTQGSDNVVVEQIAASDLPETLADKLRNTLKNCTKSNPSLDKLKLYSYQSEEIRKKHKIPNVLVDFSGLANDDAKPCYQPYLLCENKACQLLGYINTGDETSWKLGFSIPALSWDLETRKISEDGKRTRTYFKIASDTPNCEEYQGKVQEGVCSQYYEWRGQDLSLAQP